MFQLYFFPEAERAFLDLDKKVQQEIKDKLELLMKNPEISGKLKSFRKLLTVKNGYRIRVGRFRVLYVLITPKKQIWVCDIFLKKSETDYKKVIKRLIERGHLPGL